MLLNTVIDPVVDIPFVTQRLFPTVQTVCRTKEIPLLLDKVVDVPVVQVVQLPGWWSRRTEKLWRFPQVQFLVTVYMPVVDASGAVCQTAQKTEEVPQLQYV